MEKLLRALERRFGRFAPPSVIAMLLAPKVAFFLWHHFQGGGGRMPALGVLFDLLLVPQFVLEGEVWRVITYTFLPPTVHPFLFLFYALVLAIYCNGLQARWGPFRLAVFVATGWFMTVAASFVAYLLDPQYILAWGFLAVETTLLFAFATYYPDFIFRIMFVLPVKVKWLAWIAAGLGAVAFAKGPWDEMAAYAPRVVILGAVANYLLFFGPSLWKGVHQRQATVSRRRQFEEAMRRGHEERDRLAAEDREKERDPPDR